MPGWSSTLTNAASRSLLAKRDRPRVMMIGVMMSFKLPDNVRPVKDRHGKTRYRFRAKGYKSSYIKGKPGTKEFYASLAEAMERKSDAPLVKSPAKVDPKSLDDLYRRMRRTPEWKEKKTKLAQARVYDRFLNRVASNGRRYGEKPVEKVTVAWLNLILGDMEATPGAANDLRKKLTVLLEYAIDLDWIDRNPARRSMKYKKVTPIYAWTEDDIAQFRSAHPLGTMARLTLELALNTAARRCNVENSPGTIFGMVGSSPTTRRGTMRRRCACNQ